MQSGGVKKWKKYVVEKIVFIIKLQYVNKMHVF